MMVSLRKHFASEKRSLEYCIQNYHYHELRAIDCISRFSQVNNVDPGSRILEIGAAQGSLLIALKRLGYSCEGIEPHQEAIEVSKGLSAALNTDVKITKGYAEHLPYEDGQFDCVIALSVMEHVADAMAVLKEVFRVTRPGGAFYFSTTSCLCPYQGEIRFFPFFSWYPHCLKLRIMKKARRQWPDLIGFTESPAINWFTPWKAQRMLKSAGFARVYDTWDVVIPPSSPYLERVEVRLALRLIRLGVVTRRLADIFIPAGLHSIAVKGQ